MADLDECRRVSLKQLRVEQRSPKTQGELARATGMQRPNVVRFEGEGSLETAKIQTVRRFLDALGYDLLLIARRRDELGDDDDALEIVNPSEADEGPLTG